jgi:hypothetical protein
VLGANASHATCSPTQGNKYSGLIKKIYAPRDLRRYGRCRDYGYSRATQFMGHRIPDRGYWVYAWPYWYVFSDSGRRPTNQRPSVCSTPQGGMYRRLMTRI